jgi:WD40 repeat protein
MARVWDSRFLQSGRPLYDFNVQEQDVRSLDFDYQYGRLMLVGGQNSIKIFRLNQTSADCMAKLGISRDRAITQAQFLPFAPALAVLTDKSENGPEYYQFFDKTSNISDDKPGFNLVPRRMITPQQQKQLP